MRVIFLSSVIGTFQVENVFFKQSLPRIGLLQVEVRLQKAPCSAALGPRPSTSGTPHTHTLHPQVFLEEAGVPLPLPRLAVCPSQPVWRLRHPPVSSH